jgi:hypothetical protein
VPSFFDAGENHFPDPGFEGGAWFYDARSAHATAVDISGVVTSPALEGLYSARLAASSIGVIGSGTTILEFGWDVPAAADEVWSLGCTCGYVSTGVQAALGLQFLEGSNVLSSTSVSSVATAPEDLEIDGAVAPALTTTVRTLLLLKNLTAADGAAVSAIFDQVILSPTAEVIPWFSGDIGGSEWTGPVYASPSRRLGLAAGFSSVQRLVPPYFTSEDGL